MAHDKSRKLDATVARIQARWADLTTDPEVQAQRLERALASFRSALAVSPERPMAWNAYGRSLATANRRDEALASVERSLSLDPQFPATYLLGARIRPDVEILGLAAEQQVAHAASHQVALVALVLEPVQHFQRAGTDVGARNYVLGPGDSDGLQRSRVDIALIDHSIFACPLIAGGYNITALSSIQCSCRSLRLAVRTPASHAGNRGSIPLGSAISMRAVTRSLFRDLYPISLAATPLAGRRSPARILLAHAGKKTGKSGLPPLVATGSSRAGNAGWSVPDSGADRCASHRTAALRSNRQRSR